MMSARLTAEAATSMTTSSVAGVGSDVADLEDLGAARLTGKHSAHGATLASRGAGYPHRLHAGVGRAGHTVGG